MFLVGLLALLTAGCGAGGPGTAGVSTGAVDETPPPTVPSPDPKQLYEADVTVLEHGKGMRPHRHGPELCLGVVLTSLPPQCGGVPIANWDWTTVEGEESRGGTTWGDYHVVGTFDGEVFTVTEVGRYDQEGADFGGDRDFTTSCPEPERGWVALDPARTSEDEFAAGAAVAEALPNYVALWIDYAEEPPPEGLEERASSGEPDLWIMNVVVTEDGAGAEAAIREEWGGPLCVTERPGHTRAELVAIREEAERFIAEELGLELTWSREGDLGLAAELGVVIDPGGAGQATLDERYGPGMVRLFPALQPVGR